jgi:hypothetical protein
MNKPKGNSTKLQQPKIHIELTRNRSSTAVTKYLINIIFENPNLTDIR